ncbi:MAG: hypothetical protein KDC14_05085, partial [Planctomycetes bacterium]|nr:hypothetical protein [Planctomycetota bacterium]
MIRSILFVTAVASLGISLACRSGPEPQPVPPGAADDSVRFSGTIPAQPEAEPVATAESGVLGAAIVLPAPGSGGEETFFGFAQDAFPPLLPNNETHANPWDSAACLMCHEHGVGSAPEVRHAGMSHQLLRAACRSCHVQVPLQELDDADPTVIRAATPRVIVDGFADNAFPPLLPADELHANAWMRDDCLAC